MSLNIEAQLKTALAALGAAKSIADMEAIERQYVGRKGVWPEVLRTLPSLPASQRASLGSAVNAARTRFAEALSTRRASLLRTEVVEDLSVPGIPPTRGHLHPITVMMERMMQIWQSMGFSSHQGPELDDDWHNFEGLNIPPHHPSRDIQDTFYIKDFSNLVLRTHTSTAQLRATRTQKPPLRVIEMGRVFRNESTDASHESTFFQCDGFAIDKQVRVTDLIGTLKAFLATLYNRKVVVRVRPHFYPFVEPGMDIDMQCILCGGRGCPVCKQGGWLEMLGAGMIHPTVLKNMKLDPKQWSGFAFGMGIDRLAMLYYRYSDIRLSHSGGLRFTQQGS